MALPKRQIRKSPRPGKPKKKGRITPEVRRMMQRLGRTDLPRHTSLETNRGRRGSSSQ